MFVGYGSQASLFYVLDVFEIPLAPYGSNYVA
jgi:hypothetical protein